MNSSIGIQALSGQATEISSQRDFDLAVWLRCVGIDFVTGVPDSEFRELISELEKCGQSVPYHVATREDNAIALAAGVSVAGGVPLVFMESSGVGNAIDAITSLAQVYELPMVLLIAWAGYMGRDATHHNSIGRPLEQTLRTLSVPIVRAVLNPDIRILEKPISQARRFALLSRQPVAVLGVPKDLLHGE